MSQDQPDGLRQQVEFTKEFLEWRHGMALRNKSVSKAEAFYTALGLIEDALDEAWDPEKMGWDEWDQQFINESRDAREEGIEAATLHELAMERHREHYGNRSFFGELWHNLGPVVLYRAIKDSLSRKTNDGGQS